MKKAFIYSLLFISLFSFSNSALAQVTLPNPLGVNSLLGLITNITNFISSLLVGLAVIVFIWAGILFLTSAGNEAQVTKAKKTVLYGAIGLGIALAGSGLIALVQFIIGG